MRLPRETTPARIRRAVITIAALSASLFLTALAPAAMRQAAVRNRAETGPARPITVAAGGERLLPSTPPEPAATAVVVPSLVPSQEPAGRADEDVPFSIDLPDGWAGGEVTGYWDDAARSFVYGDGEGRSFVVNIDPAGSGFSADLVWRYRVDDDRFVVDESAWCTEGEANCDMGNGSLLGYAVWTGGGSATVGAHAYYFRFVDENGEDGSTRIFRRILQSIRVHD